MSEVGDEGQIMTGQGVERTPRTAYPVTCVSPAGDSTLMPPPSQGAERRTERRARRTRWGLRTLVLTGLAGAAWLITGATTHAADRNDAPAGSSLGSVAGGDAVSPVSDLRTAADQPLETTGPAQEHQFGRPVHEHDSVVDAVLDVPSRVLYDPAPTPAEARNDHTGTPFDAAVDAVDQDLQQATAPIRPTGGAVATPMLRTTAPKGHRHRPAANPAPVEVRRHDAEAPTVSPD